MLSLVKEMRQVIVSDVIDERAAIYVSNLCLATIWLGVFDGHHSSPQFAMDLFSSEYQLNFETTHIMTCYHTCDKK
jgi:hypothetical protein